MAKQYLYEMTLKLYHYEQELTKYRGFSSLEHQDREEKEKVVNKEEESSIQSKRIR